MQAWEVWQGQLDEVIPVKTVLARPRPDGHKLPDLFCPVLFAIMDRQPTRDEMDLFCSALEAEVHVVEFA